VLKPTSHDLLVLRTKNNMYLSTKCLVVSWCLSALWSTVADDVWVDLGDPIVGVDNNSFGHSVDLSADGARLISSKKNGQESAYVYEWVSDQDQ